MWSRALKGAAAGRAEAAVVNDAASGVLAAEGGGEQHVTHSAGKDLVAERRVGA